MSCSSPLSNAFVSRTYRKGTMTTREELRLAESRDRTAHWKRWGPYLSERAWGTVREDYSPGGTAWDYVSHDQARSRAYRWNEDGIAGISDRRQNLCFAVALWNRHDPILKERLFGLTGQEGNHGEDVKELYYYLDSTPTHSYMKYLYKYPQAEFPYARLVEENRRRGRAGREFELIDTGVFEHDRYFDVFVEYAKADVEDLCIRIEVANRSPEAAEVEVLPTLWFRNTWSWGENGTRPALRASGPSTVSAGDYKLVCEGSPELLFCDNETNAARLFGAGGPRYPKDGINDYVIKGADSVNPDRVGTKCAARYRLTVPARGSVVVRLRLSRGAAQPVDAADAILATRKAEADEFYGSVIPAALSADARNVMRQALAGMLWSKQFYHYVVRDWLNGDPNQPAPPPERKSGRNADWGHLHNADVLSMPDKWEYPWFAAWDLAFHCIPLALVDSDFAKEQLVLLLREWYMHPNGQIPAYEWAFSDVNPPVFAWAAWRVYKIEKKRRGSGDRKFLKRVFHKLMLNFTWWVNRKDAEGRNVFQGGFLGLDNIGVFDRSAPLPGGGHLEQSDGTSWMAMYCLNMLSIALELAREEEEYEDVASKFWEHFVHIARAMNTMGLWDEQDGFYYDVLHRGGDEIALRIRSMVGLIPLFAVEPIPSGLIATFPDFARRLEWFIDKAALLSGQSGQASQDPAAAARRVGIPFPTRGARALAGPPRPALQAEGRRHGIRRAVRAGGVQQRPLRRKLQLAGPDLVPGELPADRVAAEVPSLPGRRVHRGVPHRFRPADDARAGGRGDLAPALLHLPARRRRPAAGVRQVGEAAARPPFPRPPSLPRVLRRRRRLRRRRQPPDRLDGAGRETAPAERRVTCA